LVGFIDVARRRGGLFAILLLLPVLAISADASAAGGGGISSTSPQQPEALPSGPAGRAVYPIRGPHQYWDGFGAGRGHEGVDVGAHCGTPLVAAQAGRVRFVKYHAAAGNYVVIDVTGSTIELGYMHLSEPAGVLPGQNVSAGQLLGFVGDTGNASGCHLHFEVWEGPYYGGGAPIDPMPFLLAWDKDRKKRPASRATRS